MIEVCLAHICGMSVFKRSLFIPHKAFIELSLPSTISKKRRKRSQASKAWVTVGGAGAGSSLSLPSSAPASAASNVFLAIIRSSMMSSSVKSPHVNKSRSTST